MNAVLGSGYDSRQQIYTHVPMHQKHDELLINNKILINKIRQVSWLGWSLTAWTIYVSILTNAQDQPNLYHPNLTAYFLEYKTNSLVTKKKIKWRLPRHWHWRRANQNPKCSIVSSVFRVDSGWHQKIAGLLIYKISNLSDPHEKWPLDPPYIAQRHA